MKYIASALLGSLMLIALHGHTQHVGINNNSPNAPLDIVGTGSVLELQSPNDLSVTFEDLFIRMKGLNEGIQRDYGIIGIPGSSDNFQVTGRYGLSLQGGLATTIVYLYDNYPGVTVGSTLPPLTMLDIFGDVRADSIGVGIVPKEGLHVDEGLNVLFGRDTLADERFMWWPGRSAFRAGTATQDWWLPSNLAQYSFGGGKSDPSGFASVAFGFESRATGSYGFAAGFKSIASTSNSFAYGNQSVADGLESVAIGNGVTANSAGEVVLGYYNAPSSPPNQNAKSPDDPIFVVGNGTPQEPSNALTLLKREFLGIGTSQPTQPLHVDVDLVTGGILVAGSENTTQVNLSLRNNHPVGGRHYMLRSTGGTGGAGGGKLLFRDVTAGENRMFIDSTGNISIGGIAQPVFRLDVNGDARLFGTASAMVADLLTLQNSSGLNGSGSALVFQSGNDITAKVHGEDSGLSDIDGELVFSVMDNGTVEEKVRIFSSGTMSVRDVQPAVDNAYSLGRSNLKFTDVYATNGTIQTSDLRLKTDISELKYGIAAIRQLRPVKYRWKDGPKDVKLGLIAQELEEVIPEAVCPPESAEEFYGVNYADLVPVLIKSIQELDAANNALQKIVEQQQDQIEALMGTASARD